MLMTESYGAFIDARCLESGEVGEGVTRKGGRHNEGIVFSRYVGDVKCVIGDVVSVGAMHRCDVMAAFWAARVSSRERIIS